MKSTILPQLMIASLAGSIMLASVSPVLAASNNSIKAYQHIGVGQLKKIDQSVNIGLPGNTVAVEQDIAQGNQPGLQQSVSIKQDNGQQSLTVNQNHGAQSSNVTISNQTVQTTTGHNPAGNNGTVKIDGQPFDMGHENDPHVGCTFGVKFFNFDQGNNYADVDFELQAPTKTGQLSVTGNTHPFIGGGDTEQFYSLSFADATAQKNQGYHVKLTIHADGSQGSDVKHKVFWVKDCQPAVGTVTQVNVPTPTPQAVVATNVQTSHPQVLAATLPDTGSKSNGWLSLAGMLALISGLLITRNGQKFNLNF